MTFACWLYWVTTSVIAPRSRENFANINAISKLYILPLLYRAVFLFTIDIIFGLYHIFSVDNMLKL